MFLDGQPSAVHALSNIAVDFVKSIIPVNFSKIINK